MGWAGWSVSAHHQPPPFTWIMWCEPKVASAVSLSLSVPPTPTPPLAAGAPAGRKDPLPRLEWLLLGLAKEGGMDGWVEGGRERESKGGGYTDLKNTVSSPQPPPSPCTPSCPPIPCPYLPSPTYRQTLLLLCVYMCLCTCHLSPYRLLWWMHVLEKKKGDGALFLWYGPACVVASERFLVSMACVGGNISKWQSE